MNGRMKKAHPSAMKRDWTLTEIRRVFSTPAVDSLTYFFSLSLSFLLPPLLPRRQATETRPNTEPLTLIHVFAHYLQWTDAQRGYLS